jgi:hypothetical protein
MANVVACVSCNYLANGNMNKMEHAYLWAGSSEVSSGKCYVNWEAVCRVAHLGGLGILHLKKF